MEFKTNTLWVYDPDRRKWTKLAPEGDPMPTGKKRLAYVDPTHAVRVGDRHDAPRQLLAALMPAEGRELFWRRERAHPSGNVALQYTKPHIADHLAYARLADAMERGARLLITEDPAGRAHLARHAPRFGLEVAGLYELLAENLE